MIEVERHDDVTRLRFSTWRSRTAGYSVSCYVTRGVVIDAAFSDAGPELLEWIRQNRPEGVIVTHAHDDHGGNAQLLAKNGVPMFMHADTERLLRTPQRRGPHRIWAWGAMPLLTVDVPRFTPTAALEVVEARGHSPDHYVVVDAERETVFAADLFLGVKVKVAHPTHREDVRQQIGSVRRIAAIKPKRIFDAHKGLLRDGVGLLNAKANWMEETVGRIDRRIDEGWNDKAIVREVFGREPLFTYVTLGDWSHANFVASVRLTHPAQTPSA
jgi:glyoxylase-like metal-dependent hydrolase (beta-lactamase superfamily II)